MDAIDISIRKKKKKIYIYIYRFDDFNFSNLKTKVTASIQNIFWKFTGP